MNQETIRAFQNCLDNENLDAFYEILSDYLEIVDDDEASENLSMLLAFEYSSGKAEYLSILMDIIFSYNAIVGRRDIMKELMPEAGMILSE